MRLLLGALLALAVAPLPAQVNDPAVEAQRSVIQRDQQSAEFAARARGADTTRLEQLNARQLSEVVTLPMPEHLRDYQRQRMSEERALVLPPPVVTVPREREKSETSALPLPSGTRPGVDPIPVQGAY
jgi:hypothetical protein